jgi:Fe-S oxidoreductase
MIARKNAQAFRKYKFNEIITTDPHALNALKNEYPALGISYPVRHYTQYLVERMDQLQPFLKKEVKARIAFHDPCYLGRVNGIYDEPRLLLGSIPGVELTEMSHQRINSLCCGEAAAVCGWTASVESPHRTLGMARRKLTCGAESCRCLS